MNVDREQFLGKSGEGHTPDSRPQVLRNRKGRIIWSLPGNRKEENLQIAISNVQMLFLESLPEFNELFSRDETGQVAESGRAVAADFILEKLVRQRLWKNIFPRGVTKYFGGSVLKLILQSFSQWGVGFPVVDKEGRYHNKDGEEWITLGKAIEEIGTKDHLKKRIGNLRSRLGMTVEGKLTFLYPSGDVSEIMNQFLSLPRADKGTGVAIISGRVFVLPSYLNKQTGLAIQTITAKLETNQVPSVLGLDTKGKERKMYDLQVAMVNLQKYTGLVKPDKNGIYVDEGGRVWVHRKHLYKKFPVVNPKVINRLVKDVPTLFGRASNGQDVRFYDEVDAELVIERYIALPRVDRDSGIYIEQGEVYKTGTTIARDLQLDSSNTRARLRKYGCKFITGRDSLGRVTRLYNETEVVRILHPTNQRPSSEQAAEEMRKILEG